MTATFADYFGEPLKVPKPQEPPSTTPNKQKPRGRMAFDRATTDIKLWLFKNEPRSWAELKELRTALYYRSLHTTKTVGSPHARGHGELYDGVA